MRYQTTGFDLLYLLFRATFEQRLRSPLALFSFPKQMLNLIQPGSKNYTTLKAP